MKKTHGNQWRQGEPTEAQIKQVILVAYWLNIGTILVQCSPISWPILIQHWVEILDQYPVLLGETHQFVYKNVTNWHTASSVVFAESELLSLACGPNSEWNMTECFIRWVTQDTAPDMASSYPWRWRSVKGSWYQWYFSLEIQFSFSFYMFCKQSILFLYYYSFLQYKYFSFYKFCK